MEITNGVDTIVLDDDLRWVDEFSFIPVTQNVQRTIGGAMVIQEAQMIKGRPVTLSGGEGIWLSRKTIKDLMTMFSVAGAELTLTLPDTSTLRVVPRHTDAPVVTGVPVRRQTVETDGTMYENVTLKLMEIA